MLACGVEKPLLLKHRESTWHCPFCSWEGALSFRFLKYFHTRDVLPVCRVLHSACVAVCCASSLLRRPDPTPTSLLCLVLPVITQQCSF